MLLRTQFIRADPFLTWDIVQATDTEETPKKIPAQTINQLVPLNLSSEPRETVSGARRSQLSPGVSCRYRRSRAFVVVNVAVRRRSRRAGSLPVRLNHRRFEERVPCGGVRCLAEVQSKQRAPGGRWRPDNVTVEHPRRPLMSAVHDAQGQISNVQL